MEAFVDSFENREQVESFFGKSSVSMTLSNGAQFQKLNSRLFMDVNSLLVVYEQLQIMMV